MVLDVEPGQVHYCEVKQAVVIFFNFSHGLIRLVYPLINKPVSFLDDIHSTYEVKVLSEDEREDGDQQFVNATQTAQVVLELDDDTLLLHHVFVVAEDEPGDSVILYFHGILWELDLISVNQFD